QDDFAKAASWCEEGLGHHPSPRVQAQLLQMLAIARFYLGSDRREIESLFAEAEALDPKNLRVRHNRRVYEQTATTTVPTPERPGWDRSGIEDADGLEGAMREWERSILGKRQQGNLAERGLAAVGT